ncbi:unnamed protein product, partial [Brassica rapa subsp. trilocularis]
MKENPFRNQDLTQIETTATPLNQRNHSAPPPSRFSRARKQEGARSQTAVTRNPERRERKREERDREEARKKKRITKRRADWRQQRRRRPPKR